MRLAIVVLCLGFALAGCESKVSVDLSVADAGGLDTVNLAIEGVDLLDDEGEVHALDTGFESSIDLRGLIDGQTLRLIDGAEVQNGHYTGLRLRFADDGHTVRDAEGSTSELTVSSASAFADLDTDLGEDESGQWIATLDLRFSLQRLASGYSLTPQMRGVEASRAASVSGSIDADAVEATACRQGRAAGIGVAVYLYPGTIANPADFNRSRSGPVASAPARSSDGGYVYDLPYLVPGTYTMAWTCDADDDVPDVDDALDFTLGPTFTLDEGEAQQFDL